jgi:hypothetical protein
MAKGRCPTVMVKSQEELRLCPVTYIVQKPNAGFPNAAKRGEWETRDTASLRNISAFDVVLRSG